MQIGFLTADIRHDGNFSLLYDLLGNYLPKQDGHQHRVVLLGPNYNDHLVDQLKIRLIHLEPCFKVFQRNHEMWWEKISTALEGCDVVISANISDLDDVLIDSFDKPVITVSLYQEGYKTATGGYGNFYKPRFHKAAVSHTARQAYPDHVRNDPDVPIEVLYCGIDPSRVSPNPEASREKVRERWFNQKAEDMKVILFVNPLNEDKGFMKTVEALDYLPNSWCIVTPTLARDFKVPDHLHNRVFLCEPTFYIGDLYNACDVFVLPTQKEGMSLALKEAWSLNVPTVTTRHKAMHEMIGKHQDVDFGTLVDINITPEGLAEAILKAKPSESAAECVNEHYMAVNMVERWEKYLERILG